jgi:hypothetical protein
MAAHSIFDFGQVEGFSGASVRLLGLGQSWYPTIPQILRGLTSLSGQSERE